MRQLGGDAGSASPDGRRPWLPVELQPAAGRAETARARVGVWRAAAAHRCGLGIQSGCPAACTRVSSACTALGTTETELHIGGWLYRDPDPHATDSASYYGGQ